MTSELERRLSEATGVHGKIVNDVPQLKRGMVWCTACGHSERVDSANALRHGWPKHCGYTMTIDSPEERSRRALATNPQSEKEPTPNG